MWRNLIEAIRDGVKISIRADITITPDKPRGNFKATCDDCGWTFNYASTFNAKRGLQKHKETCAGRADSHSINIKQYEWIQDMHNEDEQ
jgi:hypothetical protein